MPVTQKLTPLDEPEGIQLKKTVFLGYSDVAAGGLYVPFKYTIYIIDGEWIHWQGRHLYKKKFLPPLWIWV